MNLRKCLTAALFVCAAAVTTAFAPSAASAAPYTYTSEQYGYSIDCPQKPEGVIPASLLYADKKGDVLIFANDGYTIKKAWLILTDAFTDKDVPDLNKISEADAKTLTQNLLTHNGYEKVEIVPINAKDKGLYAVTAKEIEIDTNGDGKPDTTAKADTQMVLTFFRGERGGHFAVELIDNPTLTQANIDEYRAGISTFKESAPQKHAKQDKKADKTNKK